MDSYPLMFGFRPPAVHSGGQNGRRRQTCSLFSSLLLNLYQHLLSAQILQIPLFEPFKTDDERNMPGSLPAGAQNATPKWNVCFPPLSIYHLPSTTDPFYHNSNHSSTLKPFKPYRPLVNVRPLAFVAQIKEHTDHVCRLCSWVYMSTRARPSSVCSNTTNPFLSHRTDWRCWRSMSASRPPALQNVCNPRQGFGSFPLRIYQLRYRQLPLCSNVATQFSPLSSSKRNTIRAMYGLFGCNFSKLR